MTTDSLQERKKKDMKKKKLWCAILEEIVKKKSQVKPGPSHTLQTYTVSDTAAHGCSAIQNNIKLTSFKQSKAKRSKTKQTTATKKRPN